MEKSIFDLTMADLIKMTDEQRKEIQRGLGVYLDTDQERQARNLNNMILDADSFVHHYGWD